MRYHIISGRNNPGARHELMLLARAAIEQNSPGKIKNCCAAFAARLREMPEYADIQSWPPRITHFEYINEMSLLKISFMSGDWADVAAALETLVWCNPVTAPHIRTPLLSLIEEYCYDNQKKCSQE